MTAERHPAPAAPITDVEQEQIHDLRSRLQKNLNGNIPSDLNTDLNLLRWIRGNQGDVSTAVAKFTNYVYSRKASGFDSSDLPETFFELPHIKPYLPFIASSRLQDSAWLEKSNSFLFVERAWSQPKEFIKVMKPSDYLVHCMGYSEMLLQLILRREKHQSVDKGPVQFIVLFDLATVNITDYINPLSGYMKLWQLRSDLWQDWYPDMVQRIYLVNPPRALGILWKLAKIFLNERNCQLIEILPDIKQLTIKHLPKWFIPKEYGGEFINQNPGGDESGVSRRRKICSADNYRSFEHYLKYGVDRPKPAKKDIASSETFTISVSVLNNQSLLFDFSMSGEIDFCISRTKNRTDLVYPLLHLVPAKMNEEGALENLEEGEYFFMFHNRSSYFTLKLEYCIAVASSN